MATYTTKKELIFEIEKTANLFIQEFNDIKEAQKDVMVEEIDRTPVQMIAYQLGWLNLLMNWDRDELTGKEVTTPALGYKWNELGGLYQSFYTQYENYSLSELKNEYIETVAKFVEWVDSFTEKEIFEQDVRKWASSTPSKWPIWKWTHINSVAPFKSFRTKIRKWKKLNSQ
ncbi:ClbS/DfsB family four-helix bundle protein [Ruoffia sp. FAM 20858]|uniref:ClbS/DfsB family four-helix bundle protein n=1 Tax=Ruoffia sp. FAM 20858 TaxID=3259516 RepID=UPI003885ED6E